MDILSTMDILDEVDARPRLPCQCRIAIQNAKERALAGQTDDVASETTSLKPERTSRDYRYLIMLSDSNEERLPVKALKRGDSVFVNLRSDKETGSAVVLRDWSAEHAQRPHVAFRCCGTRFAVNPVRLTPLVWTLGPVVVFTRETAAYRTLCRTQPLPSSVSLEFGASEGMATEILMSAAFHDRRRVVGLEIGSEIAAKARKRSGARIEELDVLKNSGWTRVLELADALRRTLHEPNPAQSERGIPGPPCFAVWIDIGGNRESPVVSRVLRRVISEISPDLIVVKCEDIVDSVNEAIGMGGAGDEGAFARKVPLSVLEDLGILS